MRTPVRQKGKTMGESGTALVYCFLFSLLMSGCADNENLQEESREKRQQDAKSLGVPTHDALDIGKGVMLKLVLIPAGKFLMGRASAFGTEGWGFESLRER
jgi:hypothetical protein